MTGDASVTEQAEDAPVSPAGASKTGTRLDKANKLQWDHMLQMDANGLITRANTQSHISSTAPFCFGSRFAKNWWEYEQQGWKGTRMWEIAGPIIRGLDENFIANRLDRTRIAPAPAPAAPAAPQP